MKPRWKAFSGVRGLAACAVAALAMIASEGQAQGSLGEGRRQATRAELEQTAKAAEQASAIAPDAKTREKLITDATAIRQRLRNGDFLPGDRIYLVVTGDSALTDTFTVRGDRRLQLPNLPDITLAGVLDSELASHLTKELGRYLKNPSVIATGLVRLTLTGAVGRNGFLTFPVDQSITDVLMTAGGLSPSAQLDATEVKRSGKVIIGKKEFQDAVRQGRTVGDMALRDGDEIVVPAASTVGGLPAIVKVLATIAPVIYIIRIFSRRNRN
jgi:polysaccharide biosynthesis/export protein